MDLILRQGLRFLGPFADFFRHAAGAEDEALFPFRDFRQEQGRTHDDELGDDFAAVLVDSVYDLCQRGNAAVVVDADLTVLIRFHLVRGHHACDDQADAAVSKGFIHGCQIFRRQAMVSHSLKGSRADETAFYINTADVTFIE